jgi:hypothetical protein
MPCIRHLPLPVLFAAIAVSGCAGAPLAPEPATAAADAAPDPASGPTSDGCDGAGLDPAVKALVGQWRGSGWVQHGPGSRSAFEQTEEVRCDLGGEVVVIRGEGRAGDSGEIVHRALGVVSRDPAGPGYRIRAYSAGRPPVDSALDMSGSNLTWGMSHGEVQIRFRIELAGASWREVGEMSHADGPWRQFFEMNLERQPIDPGMDRPRR